MNIRSGIIAFFLAFFFSSPALAFLNPIVVSPYIVPSIPFDPYAAGIAPQTDDNSDEIEAPEIVDEALFTFTPSRARTQQNLRNFVAKTPDQAARANLEQMFAAQPTLMDDISNGIRGYGFDPHNVADAYAVWMINIWGASQKRNIEPDAATVAAVKQQARDALAATAYGAKASDADRQQDAEAYLVHAALLGSAFEQMRGDPAQLEQLAEAARQGAKATGLDLSKMTLTSNGFVPRKGADASGAVGGDDDTIRNARADTPSTEGESSGLGLALAAGAGLGVTLLGGLALMRRAG
jgi:hypothetical protein